MSAVILRGDARDLILPDGTVDLVVTSPPFYRQRSYQDGGEHYVGQVGSEPTPGEYIDVLVECTREWLRVLKPSGSLWVNLGDKYVSKGLLGLPWRYALRCVDGLGLVIRAEVIWSKPNGLPESATDRVRRSHETWFHLVRSPRYFSAVDEIREPHTDRWPASKNRPGRANGERTEVPGGSRNAGISGIRPAPNPLGKLPGSVWEIATQPLKVPDHLAVDHFAAFPREWPRRIISGWSPRGGVVLDPFGGTGTTALVADVLGRHGISVDMSMDYCRVASWRVTDAKQRERAARPPKRSTTA